MTATVASSPSTANSAPALPSSVPVRATSVAPSSFHLSDVAALLRDELGADAVRESPVVRYDSDFLAPAPRGTRFVVVTPRDVRGLQATLRLARSTGTPVVSEGVGAVSSDAVTPFEGSIVLSTQRIPTVREIAVPRRAGEAPER